MTQSRALVVFCALAALAAWSSGATAQTATPTVTLRIADSFPSGHVFHQVLTWPFIQEVEKVSGGKIKFQHFPGEQLGKAKDMLMLAQSGVVDIGSVMPDYASDKMPLSAAFELPGAFPDYCQGVRAFWSISHDSGFLAKNEFEPNKVVPIITFMLPTYQIIIGSSKTINSLDDMAGLKVRSAGGAMDFMLHDLNMVPLRMTPPEVYEGLSRGTIDAAVLPYNSAKSYSLIPLLKSGTVGENFGTVVSAYAMSEKEWQQLPDSVRSILMDVGHKISIEACTKFVAAEDEALAEAKEHGVKQIKFSAADNKMLNTMFSRAAQDWASSLDKRGRPGSAALAAVKEAVDESK
jgi:TRAP-type C4-dicarboxylate transport system substrate-binding protein